MYNLGGGPVCLERFFCQPPEKNGFPFTPQKKNKKLQNTNKVGTLQRIHQIQKKNAIFEVTNSLEIHHIFSEAQPEIWVVTSPQKLISSSPL